MGKNRIVKTLVKFLSNIIEHKIMSKHGKKQSAKHFVDSEITAYRASAIEEASEYNWNESDKAVIMSKSIERAKYGLEKDYPDIKFPEKDLLFFANETMIEIFG